MSPLHTRHVDLGAKMVPFGGWIMPLNYPAGTIAEHQACRKGAVAFDVSHLGTMRVEGPGSLERLQAALINDLTKAGPGHAQYTQLLDPDDAHVVDDIIVWYLDDEVFDVMPNASNSDGVEAVLNGKMTTAERAAIAVQGPEARERLRAILPEAAEVGHNEVHRIEWNGVTLTVAGTGYTGEDGVEIAVPSQKGIELWDAIVGDGKGSTGILPAGLGARDTLRLEAGLPLHGHELGEGITPLQAACGWAVAWDKPGGFRGKEALAAEKERGVARKLKGLTFAGRRPAREHMKVLLNGKEIGEVTSGNFSPTLGHAIALAFLPPDVANGTEVEVEMRGGATEKATVGTTRFYKAKK